MNEREFAYKIKHYLDLGADSLEQRTAARLHEARMRALSRAAVAASPLSLGTAGRTVLAEFLPGARTVVAIVALALGVAGYSFWNSVEEAAELAELDTALLADDLPIDAYLDRGFDEWLKHPSGQ